MAITVRKANPEEADVLAAMVGELLSEIMQVTRAPAFRFELSQTKAQARALMAQGTYTVFVAIDTSLQAYLGFVACYEGCALYTEGVFGVISEFYVRAGFRSRGIGRGLLCAVRGMAASRGWTRLEVTTPPLPEFAKALGFYESEGFGVTGGRKLRLLL